MPGSHIRSHMTQTGLSLLASVALSVLLERLIGPLRRLVERGLDVGVRFGHDALDRLP